MSKSKGNTIAPDDIIAEYGSDVFRMYLMFGFAYTEGGAWSDDGVKSVARFVDRIERTLETAKEAIKAGNGKTTIDKDEKELNFWRHTAIKGVTEDSDKMQFNTAIARMMEYVNALSKYLQVENKNLEFLNEVCIDFVKLLAPFAPHFSEEEWSMLGHTTSVFNEKWPVFDPQALVKDEVEIAIQVNGKVRSRINVASGLDDEAIKSIALEDETIKANIEGKTVIKVIVIKGRLVNIVVK